MNSALAAVATAMEGAPLPPRRPPRRPSWSLRVAGVLVPLIARLYGRRPGTEKTGRDGESGPTGPNDKAAHKPKRLRFLIVRRNRMGDMLCAYPLVRAVRLAHPDAVIHIACDKAALHAAQACPHADAAILLKPGWHRWHMALRNAGQLQGYDAAIAVKGGFDLVLASMLRLTNAPVRIGFKPKAEAATATEAAAGSASGSQESEVSAFYTHALPPPPWGEHQIETCLRLAEPLLTDDAAGSTAAREDAASVEATDIEITKAIRACVPRISPEQRAWASVEVDSTDSMARDHAVAGNVVRSSHLALINISSTAPLKWNDAQFQQLAERLMREMSMSVAFVYAPADHARAAAMEAEIHARIKRTPESPRVWCASTATPLHLAALLQHATFLFSPEGGAGHLASFTGTPLLLLWSEGPYEKWHPRAEKLHVFRADLAHPQPVTIDEVMAVIKNENFIPAPDKTQPEYQQQQHKHMEARQ